MNHYFRDRETLHWPEGWGSDLLLGENGLKIVNHYRIVNFLDVVNSLHVVLLVSQGPLGCPPSLSKPQRGWAKNKRLSHLRGAPEVWEREFFFKKRDIFFWKMASLARPGRPGGVRDVFFGKKVSFLPPGRSRGVRDNFLQIKSVSLTSRAARRCEWDFFKKKASLTPPGRPGGVRDAFLLRKIVSLTPQGAPEVWEMPFFFSPKMSSLLFMFSANSSSLKLSLKYIVLNVCLWRVFNVLLKSLFQRLI